MKKIFIFLLIIIACILLTKVNAEEYDSYKSGEIVKYNDIAFYVMYDSSSEEDSVQLLKMTPLSHDEINKYTDNKANISSISNGNYNYLKSNLDFSIYGNMAYYYNDGCYCYNFGDSSDNCYNGISNTCKNDYDSSNVKKVVDAWALDNINEEDIVIDEYGYKARLLEKNDLSYFDSNIDFETNNSQYDVSNFPKWLTLLNNNTWTMSGYKECYYYYGGVLNYCTNDVYYFRSQNGTYAARYYLDSSSVYGNKSVRPTIKIKKKAIIKANYNEYHDNRVREYKIGDIINYNDTSFYVIKNSGESDKTVALLKKEPLTKYELNKYGEGYINNYVYYYNDNDVEQGKPINDNGYYKVAYLSTSDCYFTYSNHDYSGCSANYDTSNVKHIVDNWLVDSISEDDIVKDSIGYYVRLVNSDDLVDLGYVSLQANTSGKDNFKISEDTPQFMLDDNTKGMLTAISNTYYYNGITLGDGITVADDGYNFISKSVSNAIGTVRPVVTLNKKVIEKKIINVEDDEESDNTEITIETEVENNLLNNKTTVSVPNTLLKNGVLVIVIGVGFIILAITLYLFVKRKK